MKKEDKIIEPNINIPVNEIQEERVEYKRKLSGLSLMLRDFIRWFRGSKIWEDEKGYIGINAAGKRIYIYLGGRLYARFQKPFQTEFFSGIGVYRGNFNVGSATDVDEFGVLVPYNKYKARITGRIYLYKDPSGDPTNAKNTSNYIECNSTGTDIEIHPYTKVKIFADFEATGTKAFVIPHPDGTNRRLRYTAQESPDVVLRYRGKGEIDYNGDCVIFPPEHFRLATEPKGLVTINLTAMAEAQGLYVSEIVKNEYITIKGKPNTSFMYEIIAIRKGYLNYECEISNP